MGTRIILIISFFCVYFFSTCSKEVPGVNVSDNDSTFTDTRDGKVYAIIRIGNQVWMAQNLDYDAGEDSWVYENNPENEEIYGRLYNWKTACAVCPDGWHLPTYDEWRTLVDYLGGSMVAGARLKDTTIEYWDDADHLIATNSSGFSGRAGGMVDSDGKFGFMGIFGSCWSSSEDEVGDFWANSMVLEDEEIYVEIDEDRKDNGLSVRCIRN